MKKIVTLVIVSSLLLPSGALFAKERQGAELVITKTDGTIIKGELIAVKKNSTLLLESSSRIGASIDISDIKVIKIVKGSIPVAGVIVGLVGGGVMGQALGRFGSMGSRPLGGIIGGLVGGILGGVIASHNDEILIEGKSQEQIKAFLEKLRKKARFPDYQ